MGGRFETVDSNPLGSKVKERSMQNPRPVVSGYRESIFAVDSYRHNE
jgi:hypothetical protein